MKKTTTAGKTVGIVTTVVICILILAAWFYLCSYLDKNGLKIYFAGKIFDKTFLAYLAVSVGFFLQGLSNIFGLREITEKSARRKRIALICVMGVFFAAAVGFTVYDIVYHDPNEYIEEIDLGGEKGIVFVEKTDKIASTENEFTQIYVYQRNGVTVKQIDHIFEDDFVNKTMISDKQYTWEYSGGTFALSLNYGGLADGVTWTNEEWNKNPPEFIRKEYTL